jgi:hypothetical protein
VNEPWTWRKSSRSTSNGDCVEIARPEAPVVGVRDSKNPAAGHITFTPAQFAAFLTAIKANDTA